MKRFCSLVLLTAFTVACGPIRPAPAPDVPMRPLEVRTCVGGATVWIDGAGLPEPPTKVIADANGVAALPAIPTNLDGFNVHATAPGYPEYGVVFNVCRVGGLMTGCFLAGNPDRLSIVVGECSK